MVKCVDCQKELTEEEIKENKRIAQETNTKELTMCELCWHYYCEHAITGN